LFHKVGRKRFFNFPEEIRDWLAGQSYSQYNSLVKGSNKRKDLLEKKILFKKFLSLRPRVRKITAAGFAIVGVAARF